MCTPNILMHIFILPNPFVVCWELQLGTFGVRIECLIAILRQNAYTGTDNKRIYIGEAPEWVYAIWVCKPLVFHIGKSQRRGEQHVSISRLTQHTIVQPSRVNPRMYDGIIPYEMDMSMLSTKRLRKCLFQTQNHDGWKRILNFTWSLVVKHKL